VKINHLILIKGLKALKQLVSNKHNQAGPPTKNIMKLSETTKSTTVNTPLTAYNVQSIPMEEWLWILLKENLRTKPSTLNLLEERGINVTYVGVTHAIVCHVNLSLKCIHSRG